MRSCLENCFCSSFVSACSALSAAAIILLFPLGGAISIVLTAAWCLIYKKTSKKNFGGVTGDTAGYFLQICELLILAGIALGSVIARYI